MFMDENLERLEEEPRDGFDHVLKSVYDRLRSHRRMNEKHSIARTILACDIGTDYFDF